MDATAQETDELCVLWTTGDRDVPLKMIFPYLESAAKKNWWNRITLVVWGPSSKVLANDPDLQAGIEGLNKDGVSLLACRSCAEAYGVVPVLTGLGITVILMGEPLTRFLKNPRCSVMTF